MIRMRCGRVGVLTGAILIAATWVDVHAHEPGTTRVEIAIDAGGVATITLPVDPLMLWRQRELAAGRVPAPAPSRTALLTHRHALNDTVRQAIDLRVDGVPVALEVSPTEWNEPAGTSQGSTPPPMLVTLKGHLSARATSMTWQFGLPIGAYPLTLRQPGRAPVVSWVVGANRTLPLTLARIDTVTLVGQYAWLGLVHIVPRGLDHILFVLSLFLLAPRWRSLLTQVSAFTVAHTVTLGATMVGWIRLPSAVVEPLIAVSIAWVALENVWRPTLSRTRLAIVFLFGLLHGAGFAGVLTELGLPAGARLLALLAFNAGVEAGQALVLVAAFTCTAALLRHPRAYRAWVVVPASLVIALAGLYWTVERILSLQAS